jgi:pimeloyl-ACP methyl ester carboxylesterase
MLYTLEAGSPGAPSVVFLHGGGLSSASWRPVIERLPDFHCLAPDLPEQGRSAHIPYSIAGSADEVARIIQARAHGGRAHVVALSLGGPVAFTLLRSAPGLVDRVVLSGSSGRFSPLLSAIGRSTIWMYGLFPSRWLAQATLRQQGIPERYRELVLDDITASLSPGFMRRYMTELGSWQLPERVDAPLLMVVGELEMRASRGITRGYLRRYPGARGAIAKDATHAWCLQRPDLFADTVRAWLSGAPLPGELAPLE